MNPAQFILSTGIRVYRRAISPILTMLCGPACRFTPTCSGYALDAIQLHGALRGGWLATRRVCRCHPWGGCGHDPVPEGKGWSGAPDRNNSDHLRPAAAAPR